MDRDQFVSGARQRADLPSTGHAERLVRATLETLGERIVRGEASDLAAQLPVELSDALRTAREAERFGLDEFVRRVATRAGVDESSALRAAQAVFAVIRETVTAGEFDDVLAQLPNEYEPLLTTAGGMPGRHT